MIPLKEPCREWAGYVNANGYGKSAGVLAHRAAYEAAYGPIPQALQIDHVCRNRKCVEPTHLEAVTARENLLRGETLTAKNAAVTACPQGHPYDEANTHYHRGARRCRTCRANYHTRRRAKRRAERALEGTA